MFSVLFSFYKNNVPVRTSHYTKHISRKIWMWCRKSVEYHAIQSNDYTRGEDEYYYHNGVLHKSSGPAEIHDRVNRWYFHGEKHRIHGPAVIILDQEVVAMHWYLNDVLASVSGIVAVSLVGKEWRELVSGRGEDETCKCDNELLIGHEDIYYLFRCRKCCNII